MKNRTPKTSRKPPAPKLGAAAKPELASRAGPTRPHELPDAEILWENETFAVTRQGVALKRLDLLVPISHLVLVGQAARHFIVKHPEAPFLEAIDHAVRFHFPAEFPDGVQSPGKTATPDTDKE